MEYKDVVKELGIIPESAEDFLIDSLITDHVVGVPFRSKLMAALNYLIHSKWQECQALCQTLLDISWEHLNTGYWKDVDVQWRFVYSYLSIFKAISEAVVEKEHVQGGKYEDWKNAAILTCDMGLLMGAPVLGNLLTKLVTKLNSFINGTLSSGDDLPTEAPDSASFTQGHKKMKFFNEPVICEKNSIGVLTCPSIEYFQREHYAKNEPILMKGVIDYWPAMGSRKWSLDYLKAVAGKRTVPVEIGSKYTDDNWTQTLITINEFIKKHIECKLTENSLADSNSSRKDEEPQHNDPAKYGKPPIGYLAQHQLFDQIPELQRDIHIPTYCCIGEKEEVDINAWFGPEGTVSPLHHDPKHNILAQVVGYKYVRLYEEKYSASVYPHEGLLSNTSQVDVESPDLDKFPNFRDIPCIECILEPGQVLYIPPRCWHYIRSLSVSFSVSFWWE